MKKVNEKKLLQATRSMAMQAMFTENEIPHEISSVPLPKKFQTTN